MNLQSKKVHTSPASRRLSPAYAALALSLVLPLAAQAGEAMRVVRDPATGELRGPTAAEAAALQRSEAQLRAKSVTAVGAVAPGTEIVYPDGTVETKLGEESQLYSVIRANEDGSLSMECLPAKQAQAWVKNNNARTKAPAAKNVRKVAAKGHEGHNHD